jgi:hypothetical protein
MTDLETKGPQPSEAKEEQAKLLAGRSPISTLASALNQRARTSSGGEGSNRENPSEATRTDLYPVTLDTAANLELWTTRLTADEITRLRGPTEHLARQY